MGHLAADLWLVLVDDTLRDAVSRLWMVTHQVRVDKVDSKSIELVGHVLVAGPHEVVAKVPDLAEGPKEFGRREPVDLHHAPLRVLA